MNQRSQFGPLLTLEQLHFLLKSQASVLRFFGVPSTANALNGLLKSQRNFSLLSLQKEVRHTRLNQADGFPRRTIPIQFRPVMRFPAFRRVHASTKSVLAPKRKTRIGVRDDDTNVMRHMDTIQMGTELTVSVDVNHPLAVNRHRESCVIDFRGSV